MGSTVSGTSPPSLERSTAIVLTRGECGDVPDTLLLRSPSGHRTEIEDRRAMIETRSSRIDVDVESQNSKVEGRTSKVDSRVAECGASMASVK